jgi:mRNA-degrading endonuclease YafQ of YafQ-DinJ toxin-antitoxin module
MIQLKQHKKFKNDMSKVTFSDSQFNKYIQFLHLLANEE